MRRYELDIEALEEWERDHAGRPRQPRFAVLIDAPQSEALYHARKITATCSVQAEARSMCAALGTDSHPRIYERDSNGRPLWRRVRA